MAAGPRPGHRRHPRLALKARRGQSLPAACPVCCVHLLNVTEQLCSYSQCNVNIVKYVSGACVCLCWGQEVGAGGDRPVTTQQSFKTVLPKLLFAFVLFLHKSRRPWIRLPPRSSVGLVAFTSRARRTGQPATHRTRPQT